MKIRNFLIGIGLIQIMTVFCPAIAQNVACMGQVVPGERVVRLAAPAGAIVGELRVERGDQVGKGNVIAVLRDEPLYQARLGQTRQQVALAEADLAQVRAGERQELVDAQTALIDANEADAGLLESRLERYGTLLDNKHIEQDRYDELMSQQKSLQAKIHREQCVLDSLRSSRKEVVAKAEIAVRVAQAQEQEAAAALELQYIRAPFTGEVLDIHTWPGEGVWDEGSIVSMGETTNMMIVAEVYETDLARVSVGSRAKISGQVFKGEQGGEVVEILKMMESSRVFPMDPSAYVDRRIMIVRIRPDDPALFAAYSHAHVIVTILSP